MAMGFVSAASPQRLTSRWAALHRWQREVVALVLGASVYFGGRVLVQGSEADAVSNAETLLEAERALGIDIEHGVQDVVFEHHWLEVLGNLSYVWLHWPLLVAILATLYRTDHVLYRRLRNAIFVSGTVGLILFATFPMAPPRFMPGYVGTVSDAARRHYLGYPMGWANRFAAFPSFHVGWTLIACVAIRGHFGGRFVRALVLLPALLVGLAVVSTGNHYMLDSATGAAIAVLAYFALGDRFTSERT